MNFMQLLFSSIALVLLLAGCSSSNDTSDSGMPQQTDDAFIEDDPVVMPDDVPDAFDPTGVLQDVTASFVIASPFQRTSTVDTSSYTANGGYHAFRPTVFPSDSNSSKVLVKHFNPSDEYNYFTWDTTTGNITESFSFPDDNDLVFSRDRSTALTRAGCVPSILKPNESLTPMSLDSIVPADVPNDRCVIANYLNTNGDTALFGVIPVYKGPPIAGNGTPTPNYHYDLFIYKRGDGSLLDLNVNSMPVDDSRFEQMFRYHNDWTISEDGSIAAANFQFLPQLSNDGVIREYFTTPLVVDTKTGTATVVDVRSYNRSLCSKCTRVAPDDLHLSADGKSLWYLQAPATVNDRADLHSSLYHYDVATRVVTKLDQDSRITNLRLSDSGRQLVYRTPASIEGSFHEDVVVLDFDTGKRIVVDDNALRGCVEDGCEFEHVRFVRGDPLDFSADGSTVLISAIPSRAGVLGPQNVNELFVLDIATSSLSRLQPDADIGEYKVSDDGQHIAIQVDYKLDGSEALDAGFYVLHR